MSGERLQDHWPSGLTYRRRQWKKQWWKTVQHYGKYHSVYLIPLKQLPGTQPPIKGAKIAFCGPSLSKCFWKTYSLCSRATENRFFASSDRFLVCKTDSICIKRIFFGPKKKHTLRIIYWPNFLDWSSIKPLIVHNYSNYLCCQHLRVTESWKMRSQLAYPFIYSLCVLKRVKLNFWHNQHQMTLSNLLSISVYWECLTFYECPWVSLTHYTDG